MEMVNRRNVLRAGIVGAGVVGGAVAGAGMAQADTGNAGSGWISVLDYGAVGDGSTDDTAAIQAALNAATATQPAQSVLFPPGRTYRVRDQLTVRGLNDAVISGQGATLALVAPTGGDENGGTFVMKLVDCHGFRVTGLSIVDTDRTKVFCGLSAATSSSGVIDGVTVRDVRWTGLGVFDLNAPRTSSDITITNCIVTGTRNGISTNGADVRIIGNHVGMYWPSTSEAAAKDGVWSEPSDYYDGIMVLEGSDRTTVMGNTVTECGQGGIFTQACTNLVVSGNTVRGNQLRGIEVGGQLVNTVAVGVTVTGNTVIDCKGQINVIKAQDVTVVGNRVANTSATRETSLIAVNAGASRVTVVGNHGGTAHPTFPAVYVDTTASEVTVSSNEVKAGVPYQVPASTALLYRSGSGQFTVGGQLIATKGLGVGNSATATTPGAVVRKIEVFSSTGVSLGFIPVYKTIS
jgi:parallel beta-helix repeat protein